MTSKFTVSGTDTKITFEWTAPTALIQSVVSDCAEYLWRNGQNNNNEIPFENLTNNQKLEIIEHYFKNIIIESANTFKSLKAQNIARMVEESNKYNL